MAKTFDVVVNSKYNGAGVSEASEQLEQMGKTAQASASKVQTVFDKLDQGGMKLMRAGQGFRQLGEFFGSQSLSDIGNFVGGVGSLSNGLGELAGIMARIAAIPVVGPLAFILGVGAAGKAVGDVVNNALGVSSVEEKVAAFQKLQEAMNRVPADQKAEQMARFKASIDGLGSGTKEQTAAVSAFADNLNKLTAGGPFLPQLSRMFDGVNSGLDKAVKLAGQLQDKLRQQATNSFQSLIGGGEDLTNNLAAIQQRITDAQADQAKARKNLLVDIAIAEARRLEDVARQNQRTLVSIDAQRTQALAAADATLASTLAQIAQDSADQRAQIERSYADQIRQINQSSGDSIEDAIERRDARALSKALNSRSQQLADAKRSHDQQLADQARSEEKSKAQAQQAHADAVAQAQAAAQAAVEAMRQQNERAAEDARLAQQRQKQDFDISNGRRLQDLAAQGRKETEQAVANFKSVQNAYANFLNNLQAQTRNAGAPTSPLMVAIKDFVTGLVGDMVGDGRTYPQRGR